MKNKTLILVLVLLVVSLTSAYAGNGGRTGTAGATELLIPVGSRGVALGGGVVANTYGVESIFWNPAGLASLEGTEAMFTHIPYIADIAVNFAGIATSIEGFGTLAASAKVVSIGSIEQTTTTSPEGTGSIYNPTLAVIGLTYARTMTANVSFGATAMLIQENVFQVSSTGLAFDVGFIYDPRWKGVQVGISVKNYGPNMHFSGAGFEQTYEQVGTRRVASTNASFSLPSSINIGLSYNFYNQGFHSATLMGNFRSNNYSEDLWQGGAEYSYNDRYFLRVGYNYSVQTDYLYKTSPSFGAGLMYPLGGTKLSFEYSWRKTNDATGALSNNQFFTFKVAF
jgi:hypothetical protein